MAKAKLTPADEKFIAKFLNANNEIDFDANIVHKRSNVYSCATVEVDPICATAIDFVLKIEVAMQKVMVALLRNLELKLTKF